MDTLPTPVVNMIYRYLHKDAISQVHKEMLRGIGYYNGPFSMDLYHSQNEIITYRDFRSDYCKMCQLRNINANIRFHIWFGF